ncbi:uncharacterized protein LOC128249580 [Octopus bimaculoides]|uniref:uncharacterized protein LOC128249580 n=1 Tax=Octopus bimaculoides TaxID=37653 RepID=UPI0022E203F1|nr:uncharacterized protein LOC128249580 [Octopus bimaculoides]
MEAVESTSVMRFLYLVGCTPKETFGEMKKVYSDDASSYDIVKYWNRQFKCGQTSVETAPFPGLPHSAIDDDTIHKVEVAILEDHRITIQWGCHVFTSTARHLLLSLYHTPISLNTIPSSVVGLCLLGTW